MIKNSIQCGNSFSLMMPVKRRRAMLASNPSRNSRPELIADDGQGMWFPACPIPWRRPDRKAGTPRGKKRSGHIGPIDSVMPEKTHLEGSLLFHTATAGGVETEDETAGRERSNSTGG